MAITVNTLDVTDIRNDPAGSVYGIAVTPSDTDYILDDRIVAETQIASQGISMTVAGDISVENAEGDSFIISGLAAGVIHPIRGIVKVNSTDTDATGIMVWV